MNWILCLALILFLQTSPLAQSQPEPTHHQEQNRSGLQLIILMDINNDQKHVLSIETELAIRTIENLDQQPQTVTVITFGSEVRTLGA
jgi:hypothetical protein